MLLRASFLALLIGGCATPFGKLVVDSPAMPYQPPDINELTGMPEEDDADASPPAAKDEAPKGTAPAPAPTPTPKK